MARVRVRSAITTVLLIMIAVMIVRDILRAAGARLRPAPDVTSFPDKARLRASGKSP